MNVKFVLAIVLSCFALPALSQTDYEVRKPYRATLLNISHSPAGVEVTYTLRSGDVLQLIQDGEVITQISTCDRESITVKAPANTTAVPNREENSTLLTPVKNSQLWMFQGEGNVAFSFSKLHPVKLQFISYGVSCPLEVSYS